MIGRFTGASNGRFLNLNRSRSKLFRLYCKIVLYS